MDERNDRRSEQLGLLGRLSGPELVVLNQRWAGQTSAEIGSALGISQAAARDHLGNIYDKLGLTYADGSQSHEQLMEFATVAEDPEAPVIPTPDQVSQSELASPVQPSAQAVALVEADDAMLLGQGTTQSVVVTDPPPTRPMWMYIAAATAGILIVALLLILLLNDDDDDNDDEMARSQTATAAARDLDSTATALAGLATLDREDLDATSTAMAEAATQEQGAADMTATESANATASAQPTITPTPTETATETPEPTATPEPTETPEPTATPEPTEAPEPTATEESAPTATEENPQPPTPAPGEQVYDADWSGNPDEWQLDDNWTIDGGTLTSANDGRRTLLAPDAATANATANYAVEVVMAITELDGCNGVAGPLGRGAQQGGGDDGFASGYMGTSCRDGWQILAVPADSPDAQELQTGDAQIDDQPHTYRLEISGNTIRLFRDGQFVGEATDDRFQNTGNAGIYLDGSVNIEATNFRVFALDGS